VTGESYAPAMDQMKRLAVYYAPRPGAFADHAAAWLGWNAARGEEVPQPDLPGIPFPAILTAEARRYGFHGTLRAPFRLAEGMGEDQASARVAALAARWPRSPAKGW
jgi:hypothetical protein